MSNTATELITLEAEVAERVIRYLGTKPYREVVEVINHLKNKKLPKNLLTPTLNYIVRDDAAYSFAALQKVLIDLNTATTVNEDEAAVNVVEDKGDDKDSVTVNTAAPSTPTNDKDADNIR